jgi:cytochrome c553
MTAPVYAGAVAVLTNEGLMMTFQPLLRAGCTIGAMVLWAIALGSTPSLATDIAKGRKIAAAKCQMCHGLDGQAKLPAAPNLAGQTEGYLVAQMQAFHSRARKNDMMSLVVPQLSESEMADVSAYYAAIEVKIGKVPGQ